MKPLLRAVLVINALIFLAFGVLFLLTPWVTLYSALQLVAVQPVFAGQLFGIALIGLSWLAFHAAIDGALTATAAKVSGHVEWLSGVVLLVWLLGLRTPEVSGVGQVVAALVGVILLILGLGSVRLSGAVRRRERAALAGAASAQRAEKRAAQKRDELRTTPSAAAAPASPASPAYRTGPAVATGPATTSATTAATGRWTDPATGLSVDAAGRPAAPAPAATAIDPATGRAVDPATGRPVDPVDPAVRDRVPDRSFDPATGRSIDPRIDPRIDPVTGRPIDPVTGERIEPGLAPDPARRDPR